MMPKTKKKVKRLLWVHRLIGCGLFWRYRNPSCRVCFICKQEQHEFTWALGGRENWWETMRTGKHGEDTGEERMRGGW